MVDSFEADVQTLERTLARLKAHSWGSSGLQPTPDQMAQMENQIRRIAETSPEKQQHQQSALTATGSKQQRRVCEPTETESVPQKVTDKLDTDHTISGGVTSSGFIVLGPVDLRDALMDIRGIVNADRSALSSGLGKAGKSKGGKVKGGGSEDDDAAERSPNENTGATLVARAEESHAAATASVGEASHETSASGGTRVCSDTIPKARGFEDDGGPQRDAIIASSTVDADTRDAGDDDVNRMVMAEARRQEMAVENDHRVAVAESALFQQQDCIHSVRSMQIEAMALPQILRFFELRHRHQTSPSPTPGRTARERTKPEHKGFAVEGESERTEPHAPSADSVESMCIELIATLIKCSDIPVEASVLASSKDFVLNEVTTHHDQYHQNCGGLADDVLELAVLNKCLEALRSRRWLETPTMNGVSEAWRQLLTSAQQKGYEAWLEMNMDTLNRLDLRWESNNSRSVVDCGDDHQSTRPVWKFSAPLHEVAPSAGDAGV